MLSFLKNDPLKEKLKQAKKVKSAENRLFWRKQGEKRKQEKRIALFLTNDICPECGEPVEVKRTVDATFTTDNHYKCTKCSFEKHYWCDDEDEA